VDVGPLLSLAASGLLVGFVSGLVGVGGGVLMVPLLYFFYGHPNWSGVLLAGDLHAVVAHATSLFVIVPTAIVGAWTYHKSRLVAWRVALPIALVSVLAAVATTQVAPRIPGDMLKLAFGLFLLASGVQLLRPRSLQGVEDVRPRVWLGAAAGVPVGVVSALLGVGGGIVAIPILIHFMGLGLEKVAATSMGIIVFTAAAAVVGYAATGPGPGLMPVGSAGYIHYLAGLPLMAGAMVSVGTGARVNQRLGTRKLRLLFGIVFILLGLRLILENAGTLTGAG
jgi:uncharacterized protein